ncbi:hypothetical protein BC628DRAFT_541776 [Trametes gibbosa]|nr:hypothetical protein BC628DRAFT_541776 [Trametes gibbosa]
MIRARALPEGGARSLPLASRCRCPEQRRGERRNVRPSSRWRARIQARPPEGERARNDANDIWTRARSQSVRRTLPYAYGQTMPAPRLIPTLRGAPPPPCELTRRNCCQTAATDMACAKQQPRRPIRACALLYDVREAGKFAAWLTLPASEQASSTCPWINGSAASSLSRTMPYLLLTRRARRTRHWKQANIRAAAFVNPYR